MAASGLQKQNIVRYVKVQLLADKRKTAALAGVGLIALVMVLKAVGGSPKPRNAGAKTAESAADTSLVASGSNAEDQKRRQEYLATVSRTIGRDPFAIRLEAYAPVNPASSAGSGESGLMAELAAKARDLAQRQAMAQAVRERAQTLKLQSAIPGANATAIVNGEFVSVGDTIEGFVVKKIGPGTCVVSADGVDVTLKMQ